MGAHDFIKFPPPLKIELSKIPFLLGEIQAKIAHIKQLPIPPAAGEHLRVLYLAKGVHSTTAIEGNSFSEDEVAKILRREMTAPPSLQYQQRQITNMERAFSRLYARFSSHKNTAFTIDLLHEMHRLVLSGLEDSLDDDVRIGQFRQHQVLVGRYRAPPPPDLNRLMTHYCDMLNQKREPAHNFATAEQIVLAIVAHLYFAWIHPYGDGNGRMARLIEFTLLLRAGIPSTAAHLLSNFYNTTRDRYYRELQRSHGDSIGGTYPSDGNLLDFLAYALQGFKDGLDAQFQQIYKLQSDAIWHDAIHAAFRQRFSDNLSASRQRQKRLVLDLTDSRFDSPVKKQEIPDLSPALARAYQGKTPRTIQRDLKALVDMGLLRISDKGFQANIDSLFAAFANLPSDEK